MGRICMPTLRQQTRYITFHIYLLYWMLRVDLKVRNTSGPVYLKLRLKNYGELLTYCSLIFKMKDLFNCSICQDTVTIGYYLYKPCFENFAGL